MDDLAAFFAARLDEDEAALADDARDDGARFLDADHQTERFICRFADEDRVRRDVAADRAILAMAVSQPGYHLAEGEPDSRQRDERYCDEAIKVALYEVLRRRAARFAEHPDYRAADWAPPA